MSDDIISRLRELAKPGTSLEDVGGASVFTEAAAEIARLRLTDAEREAVEYFAGLREDRPIKVTSIMTRLLDRLGGRQ